MQQIDKADFVKLLSLCYSTLGRALPPLESIDLWLTVLQPYTFEQVRGALSAHMRESKFPPVPADVVTRIPSASSRPGPEEAWSIAVRACDEAETVVMNDEIALAWGAAKPIFDLGDEVGARMAFKEVYERQVAAATGPAKWWPSLGTDQHKRDAALSEAKRAGLLPSPDVIGLLPPASREGSSDPEGLKRLKEAMKDLQLGTEAAIAKREQERAEERKRVLDHKQSIADQVASYQKQKRA